MSLGDPFSTTYQGSMAAGESLGQGIQSAAGSVAGALQTKQKQAQAQKMLQTIGFGKQTGAIKTEEIPLDADEYNKQAEDLLSKAGPQVFNSNTVLTGSKDPTERMNQYQQLFKAAGIPGPKPKTVTTVDAEKMNNAQKYGYTINPSTGEVSIHSSEIDPNVQMMKEQAAEDRKQRMSDAEEKTSFDLADKIDKETNPTTAPTRSVLGILGQTAVRSKRALDQLTNPNITITPQLLSGIGSDMAGILQGGAPTQVGMNEQQYATLQSTIAKGAQFLSQHPQDALPDDMRKTLIDSFKQLNDTGAGFIKNNIKTKEITHKEWIKKNPDKWKDMVDNINEEYGLSDGSNGASSTLKAARMGGKSSGQSVGKYTLVQ